MVLIAILWKAFALGAATTLVVASPTRRDFGVDGGDKPDDNDCVERPFCDPKSSNYCDGTTYSNSKYLCGDWRLGPLLLPEHFPLDTFVAIYDRLGGLCPKDWLEKYWNCTSESFIYPPDNGFQLDIKCDHIEGTTTLYKGTYIDRFGGTGGFFASPAAAPYMQRSLPPSNLDWPQTTPVVPYNYHLYQVLRAFDVVSGPIAAWFEQPGQGVQYNLSFNISTLLCDGFIREVDTTNFLDQWDNNHWVSKQEEA
jgi:hypothetical protein